MASARKILLLFFLVGCLQSPTNAVFSGSVTVTGVLDIVKVAKDVIVALVKARDLVDDHVNFGEVPVPILQKTEEKLLDRIARVNTKLDGLSERIESIGTQSLATIQNQLPERVRLELRLNDLLDFRTRIDIYHRNMEKYVTHQKDYERMTLEDFARSVISHDPNSVVSLVERIHVFVVPSGRGVSNTGLIELVAKGMAVSWLESGGLFVKVQ